VPTCSAAKTASARRSPSSWARCRRPPGTSRPPIYEGDILLLEWSAEGGGNRIEDGIDTFVFRDGLIRVQTVRYTLQPAR
jgi:hypothetical protein